MNNLIQKIFFTVTFLSICISNTVAQQSFTDSLKKRLAIAGQDTSKVNLYRDLVWEYQWSYPDTAITYALTGLQLTRKLNYKKGEVQILNRMGEALSQKGNYPKALETELKALELAQNLKDSILIGWSIGFIGGVYFYSGNYQKAFFYYNKQKLINKSFNFPEEIVLGQLGETYFHLGKIDSALYYLQKCYDLCTRNEFKWPVPNFYLGAIYSQKKEYPMALQYYKSGVNISKNKIDFIEGYIGIAAVFKNMNALDSSVFYAREAVALTQQTAIPAKLVDACAIMVDNYKSTHATDSAFKYSELMMSAKDHLFAQSKQNLAFNEQLHQQELDNERKQVQNTLKTYILLAVLLFLLLIGLFLWRNNRHKQKAYILLQKQKRETDIQKVKVEQTLHELKSTQSQLIQSEKMASLGELTAGIAHEIQNPLNFVNNFSEVNEEMIDELQQELKSGNVEEAISISNEIKENQEKINQHGRRADAIVKGMLQHSRASTGKTEPTDINALADEYLRLSYHGFRAKDKNFNATMETNFDETIGKINVIPQDIGRVLLNLFNNAFYAVNQQKIQNLISYKPTVFVTTKKTENGITITVRDNGNGIPETILDKIFQPFFTTKPTGEGTGLGLSLSYDIIKSHGGEIKVESKGGEGSEFIISLPVNSYV